MSKKPPAPPSLDELLVLRTSLFDLWLAMPLRIAGVQADIDKRVAPLVVPVKLSLRECQVMELLRKDLQDKEIADQLNISPRTVKFHISRMLEKFEIRGQGRRELVKTCNARLVIRT